jgi:acyl-CoA dehydrogenase
MILLNPKQLNRSYPDEISREIMRKTVAFFENKGKARIKEDDHAFLFYDDFLQFIKSEKIFATLLTPKEEGDGSTRWDTWRNCEFNEILGFYGLAYWYTWQVTILGLGPIWMSVNAEKKEQAAQQLREGEVFAFGLSEKDHGADVYSTEMSLEKNADGFVANGSKYYIGNANVARMISTFGKTDGGKEYCFFLADSQHENYELVKNVVNSQSYVAEYKLNNYPVKPEEILSIGQEAWNDALNTVNIGKYNLGWASIGIATHAFYEALHHASNRHLYNMTVTDFSHVKHMFTDAYARLVAMKLFATRSSDYMRSASLEDRRYLLYNPVVKMKVTTQGEKVVDLIWDVIAAKGFEKDMYFEMAARDIRALPKLEGTVHVNIALIVKFMANYFFKPQKYEPVPRRDDAADDTFLFNQGPARGLGKIRFHDYREVYDRHSTPNLEIFKKQIKQFRTMLMGARPKKDQLMDVNFLLALGEIFTLVVYGQLILEQTEIEPMDKDLLDTVFDFLVRDFSSFALNLHNQPSSTATQRFFCRRMIQKQDADAQRFERVWQNVYALRDAYQMKP